MEKNKSQVMMKKQTNHHDRLFKQAYSDPKIAKELFRLVFSEKEWLAFNWDSLRAEKDTFQDKRADLVFSISLKNEPGKIFKICLLLEHKSQYSQEIFYQILSYQTFIIGKTWREEKEAWPIIPVVFHHGKAAWRGRKSFQEEFWSDSFAKIPVSVQKDMLNYEVRLLDTHDSKIQNVLKDKNFKSRGFLNALKEIWSLKAEEDVLNEAVSLFDNWTGDKGDLLLSLGDYFWASIPGMTEELWKKVESEAVKKGIFSKGGYMNIREHIKEEGRQEGRQEGIQKGQQEGIQKGQKQVILNMLKEKADIAFISKVTGLSEKEIQKLKNSS